MPKKSKSDGPPIEIPKVDDTYVQAQKIKTLEERNLALKAELDELQANMGQIKTDRSDVLEHLQRDLRSKNDALAELQTTLAETQEQLAATTTSKDEAMKEIKETASREQRKLTQQNKALSDELFELKAFQERKAALEAELLEMRKNVSDLKTRHEQEVAELKRDFDVKYAALRAQCDKKMEETEASVEARAMQRVDAVTKRTIMLNDRRLLEIENMHREVQDLQLSREKVHREAQSLRFEVELKREEVRELGDRLAAIKASNALLAKAATQHDQAQIQWHQVSERGDKQTLVLQMMVRTLEDRLAQQAKRRCEQNKQILHYQKRLEPGQHGTSLPPVTPRQGSLTAQATPREHGSSGVLNFVNLPFPPTAKPSASFPASDPDSARRSGPAGASARAVVPNGRKTKVVNLKGDIEARPVVAKEDVTALLLAATAPVGVPEPALELPAEKPRAEKMPAW